MWWWQQESRRVTTVKDYGGAYSPHGRAQEPKHKQHDKLHPARRETHKGQVGTIDHADFSRRTEQKLEVKKKTKSDSERAES